MARVFSPKGARPQTAKSHHATPMIVTQDVISIQKPQAYAVTNPVYDMIPHSPARSKPGKGSDDSLYFPLESAIM